MNHRINNSSTLNVIVSFGSPTPSMMSADTEYTVSVNSPVCSATSWISKLSTVIIIIIIMFHIIKLNSHFLKVYFWLPPTENWSWPDTVSTLRPYQTGLQFLHYEKHFSENPKITSSSVMNSKQKNHDIKHENFSKLDQQTVKVFFLHWWPSSIGFKWPRPYSWPIEVWVILTNSFSVLRCLLLQLCRWDEGTVQRQCASISFSDFYCKWGSRHHLKTTRSC